MTTGTQSTDAERWARRKQERVSDLGPSPLQQLEAGFPILYKLDGEYVEEFPDGQRFIVRLLDGGEKTERLRAL